MKFRLIASLLFLIAIFGVYFALDRPNNSPTSPPQQGGEFNSLKIN